MRHSRPWSETFPLVFPWLTGRGARRRRGRQPQRKARLALEPLEDRSVPATLSYSNNTLVTVVNPPAANQTKTKSVTVPSADFPAGSVITSVTTAINFDKFGSANQEIQYVLTDPKGTKVTLVSPGSY